MDIPAYLGEFSICEEFKQRTFAHNTVADENEAKLIIEDWLDHVRISLFLFLSLYLSLHNHKRHTHTHTQSCLAEALAAFVVLVVATAVLLLLRLLLLLLFSVNAQIELSSFLLDAPDALPFFLTFDQQLPV